MTCAPSEDSDQPGHPPSLIRVFAVRMKKAWVLSYPLSAQRRLWSDWEPSLIWVFAGRTVILLVFVMWRLICWYHDTVIRKILLYLYRAKTLQEKRFLHALVNIVTLFCINISGYLEHDVARGVLKFQFKTWEFRATPCSRHPDQFI